MITKMDKELICRQEAENDGQTVNLYFDEMAGVYLAFGWSAYYVTMVVDPKITFSEAVQMPVALLDRDEIKELRFSMKMLSHTPRCDYRFQIRERVGSAGYDRWLHESLKGGRLGVCAL